MVWSPTRPFGSNVISVSDELIRDNWAAIEAAQSLEQNALSVAGAGENLNGSARAYYDDYNGDIATLPDLIAGTHVGYASGRLAIDSDVDYAGQTWYFDGAIWKPLCSTRSVSRTNDTILGVNPNGSYVDFDNAGLSSTFAMRNTNWQYEIDFNGSFVNSSGADYLMVQILADADVVARAYTMTDATFGVNHISIRGIYQPAASGNVVVKLQVKAAVNAASGVARARDPVTLDYMKHTLSIKEIPA